MALVAALTRYETRGKVQRLLDMTLGNKPDDFSTLYLHTLFKQDRRPLRGRRGRLSLFSLLCSVRAPVAYSIGDLGGFHGRILQRGAFSTRDIPVVTIGFLSILLALQVDVCRGLSATAHFLLFSYHHLCCLLLALWDSFWGGRY